MSCVGRVLIGWGARRDDVCAVPGDRVAQHNIYTEACLLLLLVSPDHDACLTLARLCLFRLWGLLGSVFLNTLHLVSVVFSLIQTKTHGVWVLGFSSHLA